MPRIDNFLYQGAEDTRRSDAEVEQSHQDDWDLLSELVKNSMDTLRKTSVGNGKIVITIDSQSKTVNIEIKQ